MKNDLSPSFDVHRDWLEKLVTETPTPSPKSQDEFTTSLLTPHDSSTEHVLRGSKSFAVRSFRSRASANSLRVPSNNENRSTNDAENSRQSSGQHAPIIGPVLGEIAPNGQIVRPGLYKLRPSPTPSLKKKRAEAIVKAHGSPQHVRVTAGGRIVPSEQSPLCHPRYGYSAIKVNGGLIKLAPNQPMGNSQWTQATQNGFVAQDVNGRLCQIVNGTILPLDEVDGALRLYMPAPNLNITSRGSSFGPPAHGRLAPNGNQQRAPSQSKPIPPPDPPMTAQTNALELEYSKLEHELKELDKTEVLHGRTMGKAAKEALIGKRRELVVTLDNIRKAIKSIKTMPPSEAPTSPRAMRNQQSMSPPRTRLPAFLQKRMQSNDMKMPTMPAAYNQDYGMVPQQQYNGHYGLQPPPSPDMPFNGQPFAMHPAVNFGPPPPFDGSMAPTFPPYLMASADDFAGVQPMQSNAAVTSMAAPRFDAELPQTDGARSFVDLQKIESSRHSHALDIKAPEPKLATALRSTLNPESPAYKPELGVLNANVNVSRPSARSVKDRVPTPLSPLHQLRPSVAVSKTVRASDNTISPTKKSPHLHSSSVSSFETADFFPRNTREYSTRKYAYPEPTQQSEDKENVSPIQSARERGSTPATGSNDLHVSKSTEPFNVKNASLIDYGAPAAPPGAPVAKDASTCKLPVPINIGSTALPHGPHRIDIESVPDRQTHNLSPKAKRQEYLFVQEDPSQFPSSSPQKFQSARQELCATTSPVDEIDFTEASRDWIQGYRAGLARKPVGNDREGEFLDGYCAGLLKSKPANHGPSTGSPIKPASRRPSPVTIQSRTSSRMQPDYHQPATTRPPFENQLQSMDTLKEAVFAPHNENAVLTPSADGPRVNEAPYNLGAWTKNHDDAYSIGQMASTGGDGLAGFPFPHRASSMLKRQGIASENGSTDHHQNQCLTTGPETSLLPAPILSEHFGNCPPQSAASSATSFKSMNPGSSTATSNRVTSMTSIDSNLYRQWPGHKVFSPHLEWKSASSVASAAGLAAGFFANAQFDGTYHSPGKNPSAFSEMCTSTGPAQPQRAVSITSDPTTQYHSRFKEGSLDGITNPPNSPQPVSPPMSPLLAPKDSPSRDKKKDSPKKSKSPAKVKFEHIADKVGIKVSAGKKEDGGSQTSPSGKSMWRNVWRGSRKDAGKDEHSTFVQND